MVGSFLLPKGKIFILLTPNLLGKPVVEAVSSSIGMGAWGCVAVSDFGHFGRKWLCCRNSSSLQARCCSRCAAKVLWLWFGSWSQSTAMKSDSAHTWWWLGVKSWVVLAVTAPGLAQLVQSGEKKGRCACFGRASSHCSRVDPAWLVWWQAPSWGPSLLLERTQDLPRQVCGGREGGEGSLSNSKLWSRTESQRFCVQNNRPVRQNRWRSWWVFWNAGPCENFLREGSQGCGF